LKKIFIRYIIVTLLSYAVLGSAYILLENNKIINIKNTIGATRYDQNKYHIPQINYFLIHKIDLLNYSSSTATTPGQHLFYSLILKLFNIKHISDSTLSIRFIHLFLNLLVIFLVGLLFYNISANNHSQLYLLPLVCSPYFIDGSLYITTDNITIGIIAVTLFFLLLSDTNKSRLYFANISNMLAVFWRQNTIWLQLPILIENCKRAYRSGNYRTLLSHILPLSLFLFFIISWGGLTPKEFQQFHEKGFNFAAIIYIISLSAILGGFYLIDILDQIKEIPSFLKKRIILRSSIIGLLLGIIIPSSINHESGRWGGYLWSLSSYLPIIYDRSFFFILLTILGSIILAHFFHLLNNKKHSLIFIAFISWLFSCSGNFVVFQRYFEPTLILFFSIFTLLLISKDKKNVYSPVLLGSLLFSTYLLKSFL